MGCYFAARRNGDRLLFEQWLVVERRSRRIDDGNGRLGWEQRNGRGGWIIVVRWHRGILFGRHRGIVVGWQRRILVGRHRGCRRV
jgi:hypothetical protein